MAVNKENLIPLNKRTKEEQRMIARKGGVASGKARKEKATMLSTLRKILDEEVKDGMTYRDMATLGLIKGAVKGNALNYKTIIELLGESKGENSANGVLTELVEAINNAKKS